jgi:methyltransferase OMS1
MHHSGQLLLLENSRSSNPLLGMYQDTTADAAAGMGGKGCVYNQNVEAMIQSTKGMKIEQQELYAAGLFRSFQCSVV